MDKIVNLDNINDFDYSKLTLLQPSALQGGSYFTKLRYSGEPLYFQSPKLFSRNGIVETNKSSYLDLMFTTENEYFIEWLENLENHIQKLIYQKRNLWFNNELELSDIESAFTSIVKPYRGGKFFLIRMNIPKNKSYSTKPLCLIFDEHETILENKDITNESKVITVVDIQGVKFSSKNFQIELAAKQIMIMNNKYEFDSCVIKVNNNNNNSKNEINNSPILNKLEGDEDLHEEEKIKEKTQNVKDVEYVKDVEEDTKENKKSERLDNINLNINNSEQNILTNADINE